MKLYSAKLSPFAGRVRIAIAAKGLDIAPVYPPGGGLKSPDYLAINPIGKLPCLVTDDGTTLPESGVILEYLEDAYPEVPLMPTSPEARARVRLVARIGELYVSLPVYALFAHMDPATRDEAAAAAQLARLDEGLGWLDLHLEGGAFAVGDSLTLADCTLATVLFYVPVFAGAFSRPDLLEKRPKVAAYMKAVGAHPAVAKVLGELQVAFAHFRETGQLT